MLITNDIRMDLKNRGITPVVHAVQNETYTRAVELTLTNGGTDWEIPAGTVAVIRFRKADGTGGMYDTLPDGSSAYSFLGNSVTAILAPQVLTAPGIAVLQIALVNGDDLLCSFGINILVEPDASSGPAASSNYVNLSQIVKEQVEAYLEENPATDGATFTPAVSASGVLTWTNDKGLDNPPPVNITGPAGKDGADGKSPYAYAQEGGYTGTEAEFAKKLAANTGYPAPSVMDYGARGDGTTDDTVAFQIALAENRVVFVPGGSYKLSGELVVRGNCEMEISQDTVLEFTQTAGNCISMEMSASIRGHHGLIKVPYSFAGNVINVTTALNEDVTAIAPWTRWDPMWKAGRYITDLNITKHDPKGFCYANQPGDCKGAAIYISADRSGTSANRSTFIWGLDFSGIRIAGAFSYGIRAVNYNDAWNHEMRIAAFITSCEIGVSLEDCNNAYISAVIEPRYAEDTSGTITGVYAKHGIELIRSTNADLTGSRVWDWNATGTLWTDGGQWQHIGMYGDCHGAILNSFEYYDVSIDIRKLIYTDTASNLEKLTILQEPFTRWFKPKDNKPYFFDGDNEKELTYKEDFDACFHVGKTPTFTDALANAIDSDGTIYQGIGYSRSGGTINGSGGVNTSQAGYYGHTGFIAVHDGAVVRVDGIKLTDDGDVRMAMYDSNFQLIEGRIHNAGHIISGNSYWFPDYEETETGFSFRVSAYYEDCAYLRMGLLSRDIASNPKIAVDEELGYTMDGYLADGIKVKLTSPNGAQFVLTVDDSGNLSALRV